MANPFADWIAHGIMDSVVDSFFPVLADIEMEVMAFDNLIYVEDDQHEELMGLEVVDHTQSGSEASTTVKADSPMDVVSIAIPEPAYHPYEKPTLEKVNTITSTGGSIRPHFAPPRPTPRLVFRRVRRYIGKVSRRVWEFIWSRRERQEPRTNPRTLTLRRMAKTRKLVTLLSRLLASKADVVTQIRKRLMQSGEPSLGNGGTKGEEMEVAIYMGDVQGVYCCATWRRRGLTCSFQTTFSPFSIH